MINTKGCEYNAQSLQPNIRLRRFLSMFNTNGSENIAINLCNRLFGCEDFSQCLPPNGVNIPLNLCNGIFGCKKFFQCLTPMVVKIFP